MENFVEVLERGKKLRLGEVDHEAVCGFGAVEEFSLYNRFNPQPGVIRNRAYNAIDKGLGVF